MKGKSLLSLCLAGALAAGSLTGSFAALPRANAVDGTGDDWLHAEGSRLYDMNGNEVWLTGANWFGLNCSENAPHGLYAAEADPFLQAVADHGFNVIRFPISTELLLSWMNGTPNEVSSVQAWGDENQGFNLDFLEEDGKTVKNSLEIFDLLIEKCKKYGLKCFLDVHSPHSDNSGHNYNLWYGKETADGTVITTDIWIETLAWTARRYANDDTILGFDLKNEPHGKGQEGTAAAKWDDSTDENNWQYAATQCANAILAENPNALIFVEGVEQTLKDPSTGTWGMPDSLTDSPYVPAWWGGNLRGVRDNPVVPDSGTSQIVYSPHDYGPSVFAQTWFDKDFTEQTLLDDYWYDTWAYINEEDIAPLLIGEWGGHMDDGKNQKWMGLLRDYMINHHISHTFWCLNPNSGDTGGLLGTDFVTWDEEKYGLVEPSLWQTLESGKYVGLDHSTPLGANGLSLNEFYESYASTEGSNLDGGTKGDGKPVQTETTASTQASETTTTSAAPTESTTTTSESAGNETTTALTATLKGDVNCDGSVTIADAVMASRVVSDNFTGVTDVGLLNGDTDGVPGLGEGDVSALLKVLAQLAEF